MRIMKIMEIITIMNIMKIMKNRIKINYKNGAGDGNRTREGTNPLGPQPSAFDRSTTPA